MFRFQFTKFFWGSEPPDPIGGLRTPPDPSSTGTVTSSLYPYGFAVSKKRLINQISLISTPAHIDVPIIMSRYLLIAINGVKTLIFISVYFSYWIKIADGPRGIQNSMVVYHSVTWGACLLYTSPSPRDRSLSRMPSSA